MHYTILVFEETGAVVQAEWDPVTLRYIQEHVTDALQH